MRIVLTLRRLARLTRLAREDGQVLPLFAAGALAMLLMTAVVVDGGNLFQARQSLQNAADATAIAAALEVATGRCTDPATHPPPTPGKAACAKYAGIYAGLNSANGANGDSSASTALSQCTGSFSDTKPPSSTPCYVYPYRDDDTQVEVWLTQKTSNFFGGILGIGISNESARSVASLTPGDAPKITFAALDDANCPGGGENHTLLIKLGGHLTVNSGIYVNQCNQGDGFDVFGGGSISAPKIETVGGWETHDASNVCIPTGTLCSRPDPNLCSFPPNKAPNWHIVAGPPPTYSPTPRGCPDVGQQPIVDPFANFPPVPDLAVQNVQSITEVSRGLNGDPVNIARVVTAFPHLLAVGDSVLITGVGTYGGANFDGTYTVASVPSPTSFTYANKGSNVPLITKKQMSGGTATLTTNAPTTLSPCGPDPSVNVLGIDSFFNFAGPVFVPPAGGCTSSFSYQPTFGDSVSRMGLLHGTATLTVSTTAGLLANAGYRVSVSGVDPLLDALANSPVTITAIGGGTTISYTAPGTVFSVSGGTIGGGNASSATVTLTTTTTNHIVGGGANPDQLTVTNVNDNRLSSQTVTATAGGGNAGGTTFSYSIPALTAVSTNKAATGGTVTITTQANPLFRSGDHVTYPSGNLAYLVQNVPVTVAGKTFTYPAPTFSTSSWSRSSTTVTITTASNHGLQAGNTINVSGFTGGGQACLNVSGAKVLASPAPTATTFAYTVPSTCAPSAGGNGSITLVTAAANTASATAFEISGSTTASCSNCVGEFIAANTNASGTVRLIDEPLNADTGTFAPAWTPTGGQVNLAGSPAVPTPREISTGTQTLSPGTYYGGICIGAPVGSDCGKNSVPANCKAVGGNTTTVQSYSPNKVTLAADVPDNFDATGGNGTIQVTPAGVVAKGDVIAIEDEEMLVTDVPVGGAVPVTREWNGTEDGPHSSGKEVKVVVTTPNGTPYPTAVKLAANINATVTTNIKVNTSAPIGVGDIIQIDNEAMTVTGVPDGTHVNVTRGTYSTTPASHLNNAPVLKVFDASAPPPPTVILTKGVYIMAGGGFSVCGAANVTAPDGVMIYNTEDPIVSNGYGALGQVDINTSGTVHLKPMTDGIYAGMTIFQARDQTLVPGDSCGAKGSDAKFNEWDIALQSAAPLPSSGELGAITGTIYAPNTGADFGDTMSGTSNLAIITSCIYINGANSTFNFDPSGHQLAGGASATLSG